jgi:hypothetical protein
MCGTLFLFAQANFDPIGRDGCSLDNVPDEAFHLDGRRGEQSLHAVPGKPVEIDPNLVCAGQRTIVVICRDPHLTRIPDAALAACASSTSRVLRIGRPISIGEVGLAHDEKIPDDERTLSLWPRPAAIRVLQRVIAATSCVTTCPNGLL